MKLYLSGPMRGYPKYNFPAFFEAGSILTKLGHTVVSPAQMDYDTDGEESMDTTKLLHPMSHYIMRDIQAIIDCDAVALIQGWEKSSGATAEAYVAKVWMGKTLYRVVGGELIPLTNEVFAKAIAKKLGLQAWIVEMV